MTEVNETVVAEKTSPSEVVVQNATSYAENASSLKAAIDNATSVAVDSREADIFVTELNTFNVSVKYYTVNGKLFVEGVDEEFDKDALCGSLSVTFKYPSQGDMSKIAVNLSNVKSISGNLENIDIRDFLNIEFARLLCLIRKWDSKKTLSNENILSLHPKIVKGILSKMREEIGMDGIF